MKAGDIVTLKSGGPNMTIVSIFSDPIRQFPCLDIREQLLISARARPDSVTCQWWSGDKFLSMETTLDAIVEVGGDHK